MINKTGKASISATEKQRLLESLLKKKGIRTPGLDLIPRRANGDPCLLSFAQQRLWFLDKFQTGSPIYNLSAAVRLQGNLDAPALERSFNEIVKRHESLRTTFKEFGDEPVQVTAAFSRFHLPLVDVSELSEADREAASQRLAGQEASRPFDLANGPVFRITLLRRDRNDHVVLFTMHHIVSDGWSMEILVNEVGNLYDTITLGRPALLPELPIQYADFALWQRSRLQGEFLEKEISYWTKQLAGAPTLVKLPTDYVRPAVQAFRGAEESVAIPAGACESLRFLSRREGVSRFVILLAAFKTLLYRYTGQQDIVVGSPVAGRTRAETEGLIGFFVNTLAIRTDLSGKPTFRELIHRVARGVMEAQDHQELPFEKLVEQLRPERDLGHSPLFQVMFVLQNPPGRPSELRGLRMSLLGGENKTSKFDLTLYIQDSGPEMTAAIEYRTDLFAQATIRRMLLHLKALVESIAANPLTRITDLRLLTQEERRRLLEWNNASMQYPRDGCIHELFQEQAERHGNKVAVVYEQESVTYEQLNRRANQLARHLVDRGVRPGDIVGIFTERSLEMIISILAVLKAGAAYLPLDPVYPDQRLAFMLEDACAAAVLTDSRLIGRLRVDEGKVICVDKEWRDIAGHSSEELPVLASWASVAYVIYTSGSTGEPKGTLISHYNVTRLFEATQELFEFDDQDVWTMFHSSAFDFSVWELFGGLLKGGKVIVVPYEVSRSPESFYEMLRTEKVSVLNQTPSAFRQMMKEDEARGKKLSLRLVIFGGEVLEIQSLRGWIERHGDESPQLVNMYGITETTVHVTYRRLRAEDLDLGRSSLIGRGIGDMQVYVLDESQELAPVGVAGEMYVGGGGLGYGYLGRAELTAERYIPNRHIGRRGERLYRTGDLGRYLTSGDIEYLGRIDKQVKIRGFRIEMGEIEAALSQHPAVENAVVILREDKEEEKRLAAYVVVDDQEELTTDELRDYLKQKLPAYMIPSSIVTIERLPLTPNGKIDSRALPAPGQTLLEYAQRYVPPRDLLEYQLSKIWEGILDQKPIGVRDDFFDLGGHSMLAVRLMARIREATGRTIPLASLFQGATVEYLARLLRQNTRLEPRSTLVEIQSEGLNEPIFFVHPVGGNVLCYAALSRFLGAEQPFYAFQAAGLDGERESHTGIEEMATDYIEAMGRVQPIGPYLLGGWSMGGVVAYEMAQQLESQGHKVALVALLDSFAPDPDDKLATDDLQLLAHFIQDLGLPPDKLRIHQDGAAQLETGDLLSHILEEAKAASLVPPDVELAEAQRLFHVFKTNLRAMSSYSPKPYRGKIVLFKASEFMRQASQDSALGWQHLAPEGIDVYSTKGNHYTMMRDPNVRELAGQLRAFIERIKEV